MNALDLLAEATKIAGVGEFGEATQMIWKARELAVGNGYPCKPETFHRLCMAAEAYIEYRMQIDTRQESDKLYFLLDKNRNAVKIGISSNPYTRLKFLQAGNPVDLDFLKIIPGTVQIEKEWHTKYAHLRISGEWFHTAPELLKAIREL